MENIRIVYDVENKKLTESQKKLKDLEGQTAKAQTKTTQLGQTSTRTYGAMDRGLKTLEQTFMRVFAFTAIIQGFKKVVEISKNFQSEMSRVRAITGATGEEFAKLEAEAKKLGSTTQFTAAEVASLQVEFAKLGFKTDEIIAASEATLRLAQATGSSLARAAEVTGSTLNQFGLEASEANRVLDIMAKSFTSSALDLERFASAMSTAAPVARSFGFNIQETTAFIAQLTNAGIDASSAGTAFRNILLNLADANGSLAKELGGSIKSFDQLIPALIELRNRGVDLGQTLELTDKRSVTAFNTFLEGAEKVDTLKISLDNANGSLKEMSDIMVDNLNGDLSALNSAFQGLVLENDSKLNSFLRGGIQNLTDVLAVLGGNKDMLEAIDERMKRGIATYATLIGLGDYVNAYHSLENKKLKEKEELLKKVTERNKEQIAVMHEWTKAQEELFPWKEKEAAVEKERIPIIKSITDRIKELQEAQMQSTSEGEITRYGKLIFIEQERLKNLLDLDDTMGNLRRSFQAMMNEIQQEFAATGIDDIIPIPSDPWAEYLAATESFVNSEMPPLLEQLTFAELDAVEQIKNAVRQRYAEEEMLKQQAFNIGVDLLGDLLAANQEYNRRAFFDLRDRQNEELALAGNNERRKQEIRDQFAEEEDRMRQAMAEREKRRRINLILIEAAVNAVKALGLPPIPGANFIAAGLAVAQGAAQAAIASSIPAFKDGVIDFNGKGTGTSDSNLARISRGESVINADSTMKSIKLLEAVQSGKLTDDVLNKILYQAAGVKGGGMFSDKNIVDALGKLQGPDYERVGRDIYRVEKDNDSRRVYYNKKYLNR